MNLFASRLGFAGILPFLLCLVIMPTGLIPSEQVSLWFISYSAVLLSFFGGVMWFDAIQRQLSAVPLTLAMLPTLVGTLCILLASYSQIALWALLLSYIAVLLYDQFQLQLAQKSAYMRLRYQLTGVVVSVHALMLWLLY